MSPQRVAKSLDPEWVRRGAAVREFREMRGVSVDELAKRIILPTGEAMSRPYLSNIEAGRKRLTPKIARQIAVVLCVREIAILRPDEFAADEDVAA